MREHNKTLPSLTPSQQSCSMAPKKGLKYLKGLFPSILQNSAIGFTGIIDQKSEFFFNSTINIFICRDQRYFIFKKGGEYRLISTLRNIKVVNA